MRHFQIFDKIDSFLKNDSNALDSRKGRLHFEEPLTLHIMISFFSLPLWIPEEKRAIHKDIFACLFSIHNIISLSCHEQVCLSGLRHTCS